MTTDVILAKQEGSNHFDLSLDENGDLAHTDSFDTSILYSIFGERRASPSEVPVSEMRRGWLGNENSDFENGSKVWLFYQARLTRTVLNGLQSEAFNGLSWFIQDGLLKDITVKAVVKLGVPGLEIQSFRFNSRVDTRFFELWNNTGVS